MPRKFCEAFFFGNNLSEKCNGNGNGNFYFALNNFQIAIAIEIETEIETYYFPCRALFK